MQGTAPSLACKFRQWRRLPSPSSPLPRQPRRPPPSVPVITAHLEPSSSPDDGRGASSSSRGGRSSSSPGPPQQGSPAAGPPPPLLQQALRALLLAAATAAALLLSFLRPLRPSSLPQARPPPVAAAASATAAAGSRGYEALGSSTAGRGSSSSRGSSRSFGSPGHGMQLVLTAHAAAGHSSAFASVAAQQQQQQPPTVSRNVVPPGAEGPVLQRERDSIMLRATLALQQILAAHVVVKILAVFIVAAPIVSAGGFVYSLITGSPIQLGLLKIYSVVIRVPGAKVTEEKSLAAGLLMNFFFLAGVFSFAVLIGIVSEEIKTQVKGVRSGNYPVQTAGHTLILNWNRTALPLLRNIAENQHGCDKSLGSDLVLLAEQSKDRMDGEIAKLENIMKSRLKVVTREGAPHCIRDLESVSAGRAKTVIVLHPDGAEDADTKKAAAVLGLEVARGGLRPADAAAAAAGGEQRVILQRVPGDPGQMRLFKVVKDSARGREINLVEVNGSRNIARLIAQSAVQPGVANIYSSIAQSTPGAPDFHLRECGVELGGRTYMEARRSYTDATVCGYVASSDGATRLNPPDDAQLEPTDRLIILAHNGNVQPRQGLPEAQLPTQQELQQRLRGAALASPRAKTIVVLGWKGHVSELAGALEDFAAPGSKVVLVSRWRPVDFPSRSRKCKFEFVKGSPFDHEICRKAGVGKCDSIIIGTLECTDSKAADARLLSSLLVVQDLVNSNGQSMGHPPHVIAAIHRGGTVKMARHILGDLGRDRLTAELLAPNELVSGMLLQVANEPGLAPALLELIDSRANGTELHLRRPEGYNLQPTHPVPFAEVVELARLRGETALGYIAQDGSLVLAPEVRSSFVYTPESRVVVMS